MARNKKASAAKQPQLPEIEVVVVERQPLIPNDEFQQLLTGPFLVIQDLARTHPLAAIVTQWLMSAKIRQSTDYPTAWTDGLSVWFNPHFAKELSVRERAMVLFHEAEHPIFNHIVSLKEYGPVFEDMKQRSELQKRTNQAMDVVINHMMAEVFGERLSKGLYSDTHFDTPAGRKYLLTKEGRENFNLNDCDWYWVYRHLDDDGSSASGDGGAGSGGDLLPGQGDPGHEAKVRSAVERAIAQATAIAKHTCTGWGSMPAWMERLVGSLSEPKHDWKRELYDLICNGRPSRLSWRQLKSPYRHMGLYAPSFSDPGIGCVVYSVDTSGSMSDEQCTAGLTECQSILRSVRPEKLWVLSLDCAEVSNVNELGPDDSFEVQLKGGGGTEFQPAFDWVEENGVEPAMMIVFTDLYADLRLEDPGYPVIWLATPGGNKDEPPFGKVIRMTEI